ncbi:LicD family protein [Sinisalibacter aestuarii]|uniref:LicD/FKTN/FKRP nucleotidyltransferase domain-containing protein n=1 Tax=Sinisalibacter aestuarii TaxID=2949426 RepID=A0ABQ5LUN4_9RHOB|nr:LicD family protein [Sinisalibacter aestuarii]GKY88694.1 hypothetical protein STA1M1_25630 [Sinisalibacter aestuarii]
MPTVKKKAPATPGRTAEIRAIALAEILAPRGDFPHWHYFGELKELRPRKPGLDWYEAMVLVCMIGRIRPSQTMAHLNALRAQREVRGESDRFDRLKQQIDDYLAPEIFTNHGFKTSNFSTLDHDHVWDHVGTLIADLKQEGYEVFLNSGTLLGVVRDGRLIEHDDDIDLAVVIPATSERKAAAAWKGLLAELEQKGLLDPEGKKVRGIAKLRPAGATEIDLFPAWVANGKVYVYPHTRGQLKRDEVFPTRPCPVTGYDIPAEPEKMLALNYGEGWREPDPFFKFPWGAAYQAFSEFLKEVAE